MKGLTCGNVLLKRWQYFRHETLDFLSIRSTSTIPKQDKEFSDKPPQNTAGVAKPYIESKKLTSSNYKTRRILTLRSVTQWLNDKATGQNWNRLWTAPQVFSPNKVPLDIRMGPAQNMVPKPHKYGNLELVKVQNFLHLTPPSIKNHCDHLKKFCTPWPTELATDEDCEREFPLDIHTTDYVCAGQSQANNKARVVTLQVRLSNLVLNFHARDKMVKLSNEKYNSETDVLAINAERCPYRHQNRQYLHYLLTVLYFESWKTENWESKEYASDEDGLYWWEESNSYAAMLRAKNHQPSSRNDEEVTAQESLTGAEEVKNYRNAVCNLKLTMKDASEDNRRTIMLQYKESVRNLLNLPQL